MEIPSWGSLRGDPLTGRPFAHARGRMHAASRTFLHTWPSMLTVVREFGTHLCGAPPMCMHAPTMQGCVDALASRRAQAPPSACMCQCPRDLGTDFVPRPGQRTPYGPVVASVPHTTQPPSRGLVARTVSTLITSLRRLHRSLPPPSTPCGRALFTFNIANVGGERVPVSRDGRRGSLTGIWQLRRLPCAEKL